MEQEAIKKCLSCGVENPVSRVTCQVCHAKLTGLNPLEDTKPELPETPKKKRGRKPKIVKTPKPRTPKEPIPESKEPTEKPTIKRKRHKKSKLVPIQYFALAGKQLIPISISLSMKPMKKKNIEIEGQNLISLWNRNKGLLQG